MNGLTRIIGIGNPSAGDDAVGIAVARMLRNSSLPVGVDVYEVRDPAQLVDLLEDIDHAIIVDALVGPDGDGAIVEASPDELDARGLHPISSHGTSVPHAIALARTLKAHTTAPDIRIIGITIPPPAELNCTLTPRVADAVDEAAALITRMLQD